MYGGLGGGAVFGGGGVGGRLLAVKHGLKGRGLIGEGGILAGVLVSNAFRQYF